ncbi:ester cyclase [Kribbella sp. NPDC048928]|uniref:ester cyclase n=1 Tax=Kribbella sp. NPDC048928 TaxID=3364111 RepID=UPI00370FF87B
MDNTISTSPALDRALAVFAAINDGDFSCLEDAVTPDFVDHGSPVPLPPGPAGYRQILTLVHNLLGIRYTVLDAFGCEDRVVIRAIARGVGVDAVHGAGSAGKTYEMQTVHIYRVTPDHHLAEHWGVRDELAARIQLGTVAPPDLAS